MRHVSAFERWYPTAALLSLGSATALLLLPSLACAGPAAESAASTPAQGDLIRRLPAEVTTVGIVDFVALRNSPAYEFFHDETADLQGNEEFQDFIDRSGMDPRKDLHRLAFVANRVGSDATGDGAVLAVASFDRDRLETSLSDHPSVSYGDYTLWALDDGEEHQTESEMEERIEAAAANEEGYLVILDDDTVAIGRRNMLERIIDVEGGAASARSNRRLMELVEDVDPDSELWMVSAQDQVLAGLTPGGGGQSSPQIPVDKIRSLILSVQLADGVAMELRGRTAAREDAQLLGDSLNGMLAFGKMMLQSNSPEIFAILDESVRAGSSGQDVTVRADLSMEELRALREFARKTFEESTAGEEIGPS